jgi:DegV family protein with EDD domain
MIKIITDSTCNLPRHVLAEHDIRIAPVSIQFGTETYEEGIDIDRELFYRKIEQLGMIPTSSQPTPAWFAKHYRELTDQGHSIIVITVTSKHSGTYNSAMLGKQMVPEANVAVVDSLSVSLGTGWMVLEAAEAIKAGKLREMILQRLEEIRARLHVTLTPATLKYLQMSGRVGRLQSALGSLLDLKPIIAIKDGTLEAIQNVRTRSKALERLLERTEQLVGTKNPINAAVVHAQVPHEGRALLDQVKRRFNCQRILSHDLVASLAVHGGPGVIGLIAYKV